MVSFSKSMEQKQMKWCVCDLQRTYVLILIRLVKDSVEGDRRHVYQLGKKMDHNHTNNNNDNNNNSD